MAVGRAASLLNCSKPGDAALERVIALDDPLFLKRQTGGLHGGAEVVLARDGGVQAVRAGEEGDGAGGRDRQDDEWPDECRWSSRGEWCWPWGRRLELGEHDGHAAVRELIEHRLFFAEGHDGDAVDFALQHAARACGQHGGVAVGGADENLIAARDGDLFKALDQLREEWIGDVFDDDAENAAAAGDQRAGMGVGQIVELLDGLPDALVEAFADQRRAVHGSGDRGDGDLGYGGNSANVGEFAGGLAFGFARHEPILMQQGRSRKSRK